jgi:hypothetical protein
LLVEFGEDFDESEIGDFDSVIFEKKVFRLKMNEEVL